MKDQHESALYNERIGIEYAAKLLGVSVTEFKEALRQGTELRGHPPPKPLVQGAGSTGTMVLFRLGDVMELAEIMGRKNTD